MKLYATFTQGIEKFVEQELINKKCTNMDMLNGAVIFDYPKSFKDITKLTYLNNVFSVIKQFDSGLSFISMTKKIENSQMDYSIRAINNNKKTFRVKFTKYGGFEKVDTMLKVRVERIIKNATGAKLKLENPASEYWFIVRKENISIFAYLLTTNHQEKESKGELKSEIAEIMCKMANITSEDVVYDPFCGQGGIVKQLVNLNPKMIYASDIETTLVSDLKKEIKSPNVKIFKADIYNYDLDEASVTKIVTDAPWGDFDTSIDTDKIYNTLLTKSFTWLSRGGMIILLLKRNQKITTFKKGSYGFDIKEQFDILVNGKKATILKLKKTIC